MESRIRLMALPRLFVVLPCDDDRVRAWVQIGNEHAGARKCASHLRRPRDECSHGLSARAFSSEIILLSGVTILIILESWGDKGSSKWGLALFHTSMEGRRRKRGSFWFALYIQIHHLQYCSRCEGNYGDDISIYGHMRYSRRVNFP